VGSSSPSQTPVLSSPGYVSPHVNAAPFSLQDAGDPETGLDDEEEEEGEEGPEMEIDEISNDEDDRRAREILRAAPDRTGVMQRDTLVQLPYDNRNFAVGLSIHGTGGTSLTRVV